MSQHISKAQELENNKELLSFLRFLIKDQAFSDEFFVTAILEYYTSNQE